MHKFTREVAAEWSLLSENKLRSKSNQISRHIKTTIDMMIIVHVQSKQKINFPSVRFIKNLNLNFMQIYFLYIIALHIW